MSHAVIVPGNRIAGLEAVELAAQTGQTLWRVYPGQLDEATHAGEALADIAAFRESMAGAP